MVNFRDDLRSAKSVAIFEIVSVISSGVIAMWGVAAITDNRLLLAVPVAVAIVYILLSQYTRRESGRDVGWRTDNLLAAGRMLVLPMAGAAVVLLTAGYYGESLHLTLPAKRSDLLWFTVAGVSWGLVQQFWIGFINRRAQIAWGPGPVSIGVAAASFAAFHLPNLWLTGATLVMGIVWAAVYQRYPNLFALALSHALMTVVLVSTIPDTALQALRVGFNAFRL